MTTLESILVAKELFLVSIPKPWAPQPTAGQHSQMGALQFSRYIHISVAHLYFAMYYEYMGPEVHEPP